MDKKQVVVVALLIVAIVLSTASVLMNVQVLNNLEIRQASGGPSTANVAFEIAEQADTITAEGGSNG